jgi:hypothetical protein
MKNVVLIATLLLPALCFGNTPDCVEADAFFTQGVYVVRIPHEGKSDLEFLALQTSLHELRELEEFDTQIANEYTDVFLRSRNLDHQAAADELRPLLGDGEMVRCLSTEQDNVNNDIMEWMRQRFEAMFAAAAA